MVKRSPFEGITDPQLLRLLLLKKRRLEREKQAAEHLKIILKNIQPADSKKKPRLRALAQALDTTITEIVGSTTPGVDLCLQAKAYLQYLNDLIEDTIAADKWLRKHGWLSPLSKIQIDALDFISREVLPSFVGALDALSNKQEARQAIGRRSSELSKNMHAALTGRPPIGESYWGEEEPE